MYSYCKPSSEDNEQLLGSGRCTENDARILNLNQKSWRWVTAARTTFGMVFNNGPRAGFLVGDCHSNLAARQRRRLLAIVVGRKDG